jgi:hypothetical protein
MSRNPSCRSRWDRVRLAGEPAREQPLNFPPCPDTRGLGSTVVVRRGVELFEIDGAVHSDAECRRVAASLVPFGLPAILPGERFNPAVVDYLRAGLAAGMTVPDASDPKRETFRVVRG